MVLFKGSSLFFENIRGQSGNIANFVEVER
jgi:hypothetical protein